MIENHQNEPAKSPPSNQAINEFSPSSSGGRRVQVIKKVSGAKIEDDPIQRFSPKHITTIEEASFTSNIVKLGDSKFKPE